MPVKQSREDLPASKPGNWPTSEPVVIDVFAERWLTNLLASGYNDLALAIPGAGTYRASYASSRCDRALWYKLTDTVESNPTTFSGFWTFYMGTSVHNIIQDTLRHLGDGWIPEINVDLNTIGIAGSAHADLVRFVNHEGIPWELVDTITWQEDSELELNEIIYIYEAGGDERVHLKTGEWQPDIMVPTDCVEVKSINGFAYKLAVSSFNGPPTGPRTGAVIQGSMTAAALGLDRAIIVNLSLEAAAERYVRNDTERIAAEWHIDDAQQIAAKEAKRVRRVQALVAGKQLPARELHDPEYPVGAIVIRPSSGAWTRTVAGEVYEAGSTWFCAYCNFRDTCIANGDGSPT